MSMAYGFTIPSGGDPYIDLAEEVLHTISAVMHNGTYLVDIFPALKHLPTWFPGTGFLAVGSRLAGLVERSRDVLYEKSQKALVSFAKQMIFSSFS
jgi:hypothetical protein